MSLLVDDFEEDDAPDYEDPEERPGCAYPGKCLCVHPDHASWECYTAEDAEDWHRQAERAQAAPIIREVLQELITEIEALPTTHEPGLVCGLRGRVPVSVAEFRGSVLRLVRGKGAKADE